MNIADSHSIADACSILVEQVVANPVLADAIIAALVSGKLTATSGPVGISNVFRGSPGGHYLKEFLKSWNSNAPHLSALDVSTMLRAALFSYRLALGRVNFVETVWTGPEVIGSEVRRTEAVVIEMLGSAEKELLVVGYWLVTSTTQIRSLIESLIQQSRKGIQIRFVFDPGEKMGGADNFSALNSLWPNDLIGAPREVFSWNQYMTKATNSSGQQYDRKLHAKVIVADRKDALVTSANLTHAGLLSNLEVGFRVQGVAASAVVRHFELLIDEGILEQRF